MVGLLGMRFVEYCAILAAMPLLRPQQWLAGVARLCDSGFLIDWQCRWLDRFRQCGLLDPGLVACDMIDIW